MARDPRVWVREGEKTTSTWVKEALEDFNAAGQFGCHYGK